MQIGVSDATTTDRAIRKAKRYTIFYVCVYECRERETENKRECSLFGLFRVSSVREVDRVRERERNRKKNEIRN